VKRIKNFSRGQQFRTRKEEEWYGILLFSLVSTDVEYSAVVTYTHVCVQIEKHEPPLIAVIGAGVAGMRAASLLHKNGFKVTVLEARDRVGGRVHQVKLPNGHLVDMGPNWIHGTEGNPMTLLAQETGTESKYVIRSGIGQATIAKWWNQTDLSLFSSTSEASGQMSLFDEDGELLPVDEGNRCSELFWNLVEKAFAYSNENCQTIDPEATLLDYFEEHVKTEIPETEVDFEDKRKRLFQLAQSWGNFVGARIDQQSLKFFWLEECLQGGMFD
jgi:hypothetical protein